MKGGPNPELGMKFINELLDPETQALIAGTFFSKPTNTKAVPPASLQLPDLIVLPSWGIVLASNIAIHPERALEYVVASLGASLFLFLALLAYPKGMGMGDVKLALLLGAMLGKSVAVGMMIGMLAALVYSTVLFARHGLGARKMAIPFGPFLAFGANVRPASKVTFGAQLFSRQDR